MSELDLLRARYEKALRKLARVMELDYREAVGMFGDIEVATSRAGKIVGFFQKPEINAALEEVIGVSADYQAWAKWEGLLH